MFTLPVSATSVDQVVPASSDLSILNPSNAVGPPVGLVHVNVIAVSLCACATTLVGALGSVAAVTVAFADCPPALIAMTSYTYPDSARKRDYAMMIKEKRSEQNDEIRKAQKK